MPSGQRHTLRSPKEADRRIIQAVVRLSIWLGIPLSVGSQILAGNPFGWQWATAIGMAIVALAGKWCLHTGRDTAAIDAILWGATLVISLQCIALHSIRTPLATLFPLMVMMCGWLRGKRAAYLLGGTLIGFLSVMAGLEQLYWPIPTMRSPAIYWTVQVFGIVLAGSLILHVTEGIRLQLRRSTRIRRRLAGQSADLRHLQKNFEAYFHMNPVPVCITRIEDGTLYEINPAFERVFGWTREEAVGKKTSALGLWVLPEDRMTWVCEIQNEGKIRNYLTRYRTKAGLIRWFMSNAEVVEYSQQQCIFAAFVDITQEREARDSLQRLNTELEQRVEERTRSLSESNASLSRTVEQLQRAQEELVHAEMLASLGSLVAGISHELNTPIGNALTVATTMTEHARSFETEVDSGKLTRSGLQQFVDTTNEASVLVARNLRRAAELIGSFKQVAIDQTSERRRTFQLHEVINDVLETLRPGFRHQPITLHTSLESGLELDSYPGPIGQVITNLVQNAVFHGFEQQARGDKSVRTKGEIHVGCLACGEDLITIVVSDNGRGIDADHLSRVFDPFFTTRLGQGGSGLGLSIVHRIVTSLLGGTISVHSAPGEGARFSIVLPRKARNTAKSAPRFFNTSVSMTLPSKVLLVLTNTPDQACAETIAGALVEQALAACVNILAPCQSVYRWQGKIERATEVPLLIKTTTAHYAALEVAIRQLHPYEVPEIVAWPLSHGLPAYCDWVGTETAAAPHHKAE